MHLTCCQVKCPDECTVREARIRNTLCKQTSVVLFVCSSAAHNCVTCIFVMRTLISLFQV